MPNDTPEKRLADLNASFEEAGPSVVRAELDLRRLGTKGSPSQTNAAVVWLKNKTDQERRERRATDRKNTRRWLITTLVAVLSLVIAVLAFILAAGQP